MLVSQSSGLQTVFWGRFDGAVADCLSSRLATLIAMTICASGNSSAWVSANDRFSGFGSGNQSFFKT